jgi:hypothetical protein
VQAGEGDHVYGELAEIAVKLAGEAEGAGGAAYGGGHKMVEVAIGRSGELEGAEADVVQSFVVEGETLVGVFDKLVDGEGGVVGLHDGVGHLGTVYRVIQMQYNYKGGKYDKFNISKIYKLLYILSTSGLLSRWT